MVELLVLTAADGPYLPYALPYATSVLHHNDDCKVEIFVPDRDHFCQAHGRAIAKLAEFVGPRLVVSEAEFDTHASIVRFIKQPATTAAYVYIGDIDVLVLEPIAPQHIEIMRKNKLRYSNEVKANKDGPTMTGLHFSEYDFYYPVEIPDDIDLGSLDWDADGSLLYRMVSAKAKPRTGKIGRPLHGFHMSQYGWPLNQWGVRDRSRRDKYEALRGTPLWREMRALFDPRYLVYLDILEAAIKGCDYFTDQDIKDSSILSGRGAQTHLR
ncbi:hypothetical protein [Chelatococcus reniformis]|uniref:Uncharacterized protein n=1 Tax=Chelatococcus reniformis TaxID=1494448 RepID=A0A916XJ84_9HYPH|nr:hypothetical protein [Chelatococcus reniformis]GGC74468.1 hypothetical protein GCM10010994_36150 [Chelatococcus reniformis]